MINELSLSEIDFPAQKQCLSDYIDHLIPVKDRDRLITIIQFTIDFLSSILSEIWEKFSPKDWCFKLYFECSIS